MHIIFGAGPAGLYTAIKLRFFGIKDLTIYDQRTEYTRTGHLSSEAFRKAQDGLGVRFWATGFGHIKELERILLKIAKALNIKIEQKQFLRLHPDPISPTVVIADPETTAEEYVPADFVFDCTGSRRAVISAVNALCPDSPFQLKTFADIPVPNHFLAYVKMDDATFAEVRCAHKTDIATFDPVKLARSLIRLRAFGWDQIKLPRCYGVSFGKGKVCMYLETPPNLAKSDHDHWFQAVLDCFTTKPASYQHLPLSKKYAAKKQRFTPFKISAQALSEIYYKGKDIPPICALGDTQVDPDYFLASGIHHGIERIDLLFNALRIKDEKIQSIDPSDLLRVHHQLREDIEEISNNKIRQNAALIAALAPTKLKLEAALTQMEPSEARLTQEIIDDINARQCAHQRQRDNSPSTRTPPIDSLLAFSVFSDTKNTSEIKPQAEPPKEQVTHTM